MKSITSRRQLKDSLRVWTSDAYEDVKEEQRLGQGQTYLKSYLIESDRESIDQRFMNKENLSMKVDETDDEGFYKLTARGYSSGKPTVLFLDELDERFLVLHTVGGRDATDKVVEDLIYPRFTKLDRPWLPNEFLEDIGEQPGNIFRKFSLKYKNEFGKEELEDEEPDVDKLSMQLWGENAAEVLNTLRENKDLSQTTPLSTVGIKKSVNDEKVIDDITYYSKFTARGDSVDGHFQQVRGLKDDYKDLLLRIEDEFSLDFNSNKSGTTVKGKPLLIAFDRRIENIEEFLDELFSSKKPFRLWGVRNKLDDDYYRISAVDLHTGDKLSIEACGDWMRVYLPQDSCGNVILRLYTNIQHYWDSKAKLEQENNGSII